MCAASEPLPTPNMARSRRKGTWSFVVYFAVLVGIALYTAAFAAYAIQLLHLRVEHTYQLPPGAPGVLRSRRYGVTWVFRVFLAARYPFILFVALMLAWRKFTWCMVPWGVLAGLMWLGSVGALMFLAKERVSCNGSHQAFNACSDLLYCCVAANYNDPSNGCPNTGACPFPIPSRPEIAGPTVLQSDLAPNPDFTFLLWSTVGFAAVDLVLFVIAAAVVLREPDWRKRMAQYESLRGALHSAERLATRIGRAFERPKEPERLTAADFYQLEPQAAFPAPQTLIPSSGTRQRKPPEKTTPEPAAAPSPSPLVVVAGAPPLNLMMRAPRKERGKKEK